MTKVVIVSTFPPQRCGVAEYAQHLADGYRQAGASVQIVAEQSFIDGIAWSDDHVRRRWERSIYRAKELVDEITSLKPDLVEFQHEFGIWPDTPKFCQLLDLIRVPKIVTLHTVPLLGHFDLREQTNVRFIVHTTRGLLAWPSATLLPHPTPPCWADKASRDPDLVVTVGFVSPSKNIEMNLEALAETYGKLRYIIAGDGPSEYIRQLERRAWALGMNKRVSFELGYHSHEKRQMLLAHCGLAILNTRGGTWPSASGVARECLATGTPTASALVPIYDDLNWHVGAKFQEPAELTQILSSRFWTKETFKADASGYFARAASWTFKSAAEARLELVK